MDNICIGRDTIRGTRDPTFWTRWVGFGRPFQSRLPFTLIMSKDLQEAMYIYCISTTNPVTHICSS